MVVWSTATPRSCSISSRSRSLIGNIRYQRTAHRITSAVNCRPLKSLPCAMIPAAIRLIETTRLPNPDPPHKFVTEPLGEASAPAEPGECAFDKPSARQHLKPFGRVESRDDLDGPVTMPLEGIAQFAARIAAIGRCGATMESGGGWPGAGPGLRLDPAHWPHEQGRRA